MRLSSVPFLARATPPAGGGPLNVVAPTAGEGYGSVLTLTIPAVAVGNSLIIGVTNATADTRVDGATEDAGAAPMLFGMLGHFFRINNVVDGRTSLTLRTFNGSAVPTDDTSSWSVYEVDATGVVVASSIASSAVESNGTALDQAFTTTLDDAAAFLLANLSNAATALSGGGWTGIGAATYTPAGYNANVGAAGAKVCGVTLDSGRFRGMSVLAYARA